MKEFKYLKKHKALNESKNGKSVNENVLVVNDGEIFKVSTVVNIPKKIINAVLKKAKEETGRDPKIFWNEVAVADEIVKFILDTYLNAESLPASILTGDTSLSTSVGEEGDDFSEEGDVDDLSGDLEGEDTDVIADDLELDGSEEGEEDNAEEAEEAEEAEGEDVPSLDSGISDDEEEEESNDDSEEEL